MKLAVSSIAWTKDEEPAVADLLQSLGVKYVEIAPTKVWHEPVAATTTEIDDYLGFWKDHAIEVVAFQSMLFTHPEMKIFDENSRQQTLDYLDKFTQLAGKMGARVMVFGSPKNRQKGQLSDIEAEEIATQFFGTLGDIAARNNTSFCIEPNPTQYACDFVTNAQEGIDFVNSVSNPGFGLHLDIAGMTLAGDDVAASIRDAAPILRHFHISAPQLEQVEDRPDVDYRAAAGALAEIGYKGFVSIEMRPAAEGENLARVGKAVRFAQSVYNS